MPDSALLMTLLLEGIADYAVFMVDAEGRVNRWSSSARKVFGYTADEIRGMHFSNLYPADDENPTFFQEQLQMAAAHGRFEDTGWRVRHDGSKFWADSVICPVRDENGQFDGFSHIVRDISERKKAEEALHQKEEELSNARKMEAIGRLAGGVAHDFNNFITGIVGLADEVRLSMAEQDPRRDDLAEIIKIADQARLLTRELLAFGKRQVSAPQMIHLNEVVQSKQRMLMRLIGPRIQLKVMLDPTIRHILIDPTHLDQILINLLMNARDAMPQGGAISIETHRVRKEEWKDSGHAAPYVLLTVTDSGTGMDDQTLTQAFEPFFTTKEQGKGTGLGLATVYGIVNQNHGLISVKSRPGEGTAIQIQFPEIDGPVELPVNGQTLEAAPIAGSETILVVDDTDIVRRVVTQALRNHGYKVLSAGSGSEALEIAEKYTEPIDMLVTDVVMIGINGRQLADQLRTSHPETKVLYMSGFAEDFVQERGFLTDPDAFIQKPLTGPSLVNKVRKILDNRPLASSSPQA
jgi:PAS domain S-box-containing protein